jgi:beta-phosphoglucomutase-like phosphatase (HAD superfamily)
MPAWNYRCVVFDLDGTMVDTEPVFERAVSELLRDRGLALTPALAHRMLGTPTRQAFEHLRDHFGLTEDLDSLCEESIDRLFALFDVDPPQLLSGVRSLLDALHQRNIPRAIATSSHREHVDRVLAPHKVLHHFAFVMTCEDVSRGKPAPEIYEKTARRLGVSPEEMVVLEDSPNGMRAAKEAGARCIVIPHSRVPTHDLGLADAIVSSLESLEFLELMGLV